MTKILTVSNKQEAVLILNDAQKVKSFNITLDTEKDDETNKKQQQEVKYFILNFRRIDSELQKLTKSITRENLIKFRFFFT